MTQPHDPSQPPRHFTFILVEEFSHLAFSCAVEPLRIANLISGRTLYEWSFASENGTTATCSNGSVTLVHHALDALPRANHLFVLSGIHMDRHVSPSLLAALRRERARGAPIGALCSGAYILAAAGFLNGMSAAIHWDYHDSFMEAFPDVHLVRHVFVPDARHVTASGGTATADLMLHMIEQAHGHDLSVAVSDMMVYSGARAATGAQRVSLQSRRGMRNAHLARAVKRMQDSIEAPVSPTLIAQELGISVRQLERLFGRFLNASPKKYHMEMRLERAQHLLVQTEQSVIEIALACGFESPGHFTRVYRTAFGVTPSEQRSRMG